MKYSDHLLTVVFGSLELPFMRFLTLSLSPLLTGKTTLSSTLRRTKKKKKKKHESYIYATKSCVATATAPGPELATKKVWKKKKRE